MKKKVKIIIVAVFLIIISLAIIITIIDNASLIPYDERINRIQAANSFGEISDFEMNDSDPSYCTNDKVVFFQGALHVEPGCYYKEYFWTDNPNEDNSCILWCEPDYIDWVYLHGLAHEDITMQQIRSAIFVLTLENNTSIDDIPVLETVLLDTINHFEGNTSNISSGEAIILELITKISPYVEEKYGDKTPLEIHLETTNEEYSFHRDQCYLNDGEFEVNLIYGNKIKMTCDGVQVNE